MKIYSITENKDETLYWSNELGWVDYASATNFVLIDAKSMPIGWSGIEERYKV